MAPGHGGHPAADRQERRDGREGARSLRGSAPQAQASSTTTAARSAARYRRQDEIGTPWAFTVDEQTLADDTVTVRDRDSLEQERIPIAGVQDWLEDALERDWKSPKAN